MNKNPHLIHYVKWEPLHQTVGLSFVFNFWWLEEI